MTLQTIRDYFNFFENKVLPELKKTARQELEGYHGLETHTYQVVFRAVDYALKLNQNPMPVLFAAALHDSARSNDQFDVEHGLKALPLARQLMSSFADYLTQSDRKSVLRAIAQHTIGRHPLDYVSACLWDADRTRLSWERGFDASYFATEHAKKVAAADPRPYLSYQAQVLDKPFEDREQVLLDLRATFHPHQFFSKKTFCLRHQYMLWGRQQPFHSLGIAGDLKRFLLKGAFTGHDGFYSYLVPENKEKELDENKIFLFFNISEDKLRAPLFRLDHTACEIDFEKKGVESFYLMNKDLFVHYLPLLKTGEKHNEWEAIVPVKVNFGYWEEQIFQLPHEAEITAIRLRTKAPFYYQYLLENKEGNRYIVEPSEHLVDGFSNKIASAVEDILFQHSADFAKAYTIFLQKDLMQRVKNEEWTCALVYRGAGLPLPTRLVYKGHLLFDAALHERSVVAEKITPAFLEDLEQNKLSHHNSILPLFNDHTRS